MDPQLQSLQSQSKGGSDTSDKSINILCFDGGGVRGLSSLLILRDILEQSQVDSDAKRLPLPCEVFDMICGTSTGGIIALMLGRLRMNVADAISSYLNFSETVFQEKSTEGSAKYKYDASKLEKWVENVVVKYTQRDHAPLKDPSESEGNFCRTFVVAVTQAYADAPAKIFRTYQANGRPVDPCTISEAARATTAAFPFFEPATFGSPRATYVDGSLSGSNNPSQLAIDEIGDVFPSRKIGCFLSLGTGVPDVVSLPEDADGIAKACVKLVESCEKVHNSTFKDFKRNARGEGYIRLSVDRGLGQIQLDEWRREADLTGITHGYLRHAEVEERAMKCVVKLKEKAMELRMAEEDSIQ